MSNRRARNNKTFDPQLFNPALWLEIRWVRVFFIVFLALSVILFPEVISQVAQGNTWALFILTTLSGIYLGVLLDKLFTISSEVSQLKRELRQSTISLFKSDLENLVNATNFLLIGERRESINEYLKKAHDSKLKWGLLEVFNEILHILFSKQYSQGSLEFNCTWQEYKYLIDYLTSAAKKSVIWTLYGTPLTFDVTEFREPHLTEYDVWFRDWMPKDDTWYKARIVIFKNKEEVKQYVDTKEGHSISQAVTNTENKDRIEKFEQSIEPNQLFFTTEQYFREWLSLKRKDSNNQDNYEYKDLDFGIFDSEVVLRSRLSPSQSSGSVKLSFADSQFWNYYTKFQERLKEENPQELKKSLEGGVYVQKMLFRKAEDLLHKLELDEQRGASTQASN